MEVKWLSLRINQRWLLQLESVDQEREEKALKMKVAEDGDTLDCQQYERMENFCEDKLEQNLNKHERFLLKRRQAEASTMDFATAAGRLKNILFGIVQG